MEALPNPYAYAASSPLRLVDPLGLFAGGFGGGHGGAFVPLPGKLGIIWDVDCFMVGDDDGNFGLLCCAGGGFGTGAGTVAGLQASAALCFNCDTVCDMEGEYVAFQGGVGGTGAVAGGGGGSFSPSGTTWIGGIGPGGGGGGYVGFAYGKCKLAWPRDCGRCPSEGQ